MSAATPEPPSSAPSPSGVAAPVAAPAPREMSAAAPRLDAPAWLADQTVRGLHDMLGYPQQRRRPAALDPVWTAMRRHLARRLASECPNTVGHDLLHRTASWLVGVESEVAPTLWRADHRILLGACLRTFVAIASTADVETRRALYFALPERDALRRLTATEGGAPCRWGAIVQEVLGTSVGAFSTGLPWFRLGHIIGAGLSMQAWVRHGQDGPITRRAVWPLLRAATTPVVSAPALDVEHLTALAASPLAPVRELALWQVARAHEAPAPARTRVRA